MYHVAILPPLISGRTDGNNHIGRRKCPRPQSAAPSHERDSHEVYEALCKSEERYNVNENITKSGARVWVAWTNKVLTDDHGKTIGVLSIGSDITKQRLLATGRRAETGPENVGHRQTGRGHFDLYLPIVLDCRKHLRNKPKKSSRSAASA